MINDFNAKSICRAIDFVLPVQRFICFSKFCETCSGSNYSACVNSWFCGSCCVCVAVPLGKFRKFKKLMLKIQLYDVYKFSNFAHTSTTRNLTLNDSIVFTFFSDICSFVQISKLGWQQRILIFSNISCRQLVYQITCSILFGTLCTYAQTSI